MHKIHLMGENIFNNMLKCIAYDNIYAYSDAIIRCMLIVSKNECSKLSATVVNSEGFY